MSYQIIKQPDNLFSIFDICTDTFCLQDLSEQEVINFFEKQVATIMRRKITDILEKLEKGDNPYYQLALTFEEAQRLDAETRNFKGVTQ